MTRLLASFWSDIASWLARGASSDAIPNDGTGMERSFGHTLPWAPWVTLLLMILVCSFVIQVYRKEAITGRWLRYVLMVLRIGVIAVVIFMLYGWIERQHRTELPELVIALDVSESMAMIDRYRENRIQAVVEKYFAADGSRLGQAKSFLDAKPFNWLELLTARYRVRLVTIGDSVRPIELSIEEEVVSLPPIEATDATSRLGEAMQAIIDGQRGRSTAAILLFTDGVTTDGPTLSEVAGYAERHSVPLHIVGLGSEEPPRDVQLGSLLGDDVAFVGDVLHFDLQLQHVGMSGRQATVSLRRADDITPLTEVVVELTDSTTPIAVRLPHRPTEEGDFDYEIHVTKFDDEPNHENNQLAATVRVQNETIRVLMVQAAPSYEYRYLKSLLTRATKRGDTSEKAIEVTTVLQEADLDFVEVDDRFLNVFPVKQEELFEYDVIIFGDANPAFFSQSVLGNIRDFVINRGGGMVFISGPNYFPKQYVNSPLADLLPFDPATAMVPVLTADGDSEFRVQPTPIGFDSPTFQLGDSRRESATIWKQLPELRWLLEVPDVNTTAMVLAEHPSRQSIAGRASPVIMMQFIGAGKVICHATDETYLWSRFDGNDEVYGRYWHQTLRYLSRSKLLADSSPIDITSDLSRYVSGDEVLLRVLFRDERLAPAGSEDVTVSLTSDQGQQTPVVLSRSSTNRGLFETAIPDLAVGAYEVQLAAPMVPSPPTSVQFTVESLLNERSRLEMDARGLKTAAEASRGRFYTLRDAPRILRSLPPGDQVRIESSPPRSIWNSSWLAGMFITLLATEWILRKRAGLL